MQKQLPRIRMNAYPVPVREGESAISSLIVGGDGRVYGATSGRNAHLFAFCNVLGKRVTAIQAIPGPASIRNSLAMDEDMNLYAGVTTQGADGVPHGVLHSLGVEVGMNFYEEAVGATSFKVVKPLRPLLEPVAGEGILCLHYHRSSRSLVGLTTPGTKLFKYSLDTGDCETIATISPGGSVVAKRKGRLISKCLIEMEDSHLYGTGEGGHFFKYDVAAGEASYLPQRLPGMAVRRDWNSAECLCSDGAGNIYGGTTDGFVFKFSPSGGKLVNFGKPSLERPVRGLAHKEGVLYGVCGSDNGIADLFSYDLSTSHFEDLGMLNYIPCEGGESGGHNVTPWSAWRVATLVKDCHGTIYLGEDDSKGHLFTFFT